MKRGLLTTCLVLAASIGLTGCAGMPDLNTEQQEMVSQYAVGLLLKYDSENHSRLVDTSNFWDSYNTANRLYEEAKNRYYDELQKEQDKAKEEASHQAELNNSATESGSKNNSSDGTGGAMVVDARSIGSFLGYNDFDISYAGNDIMNSYPEDASNLQLVLNANSGNDLLVLYFNVTNKSGETKTFDMISSEPIFKLSVNGDNYYSVLKTFILEDDMSVYLGDFKAGETKRLVLLTEVKDKTVVSSIGLRITMGNDSITKSLK